MFTAFLSFYLSFFPWYLRQREAGEAVKVMCGYRSVYLCCPLWSLSYMSLLRRGGAEGGSEEKKKEQEKEEEEVLILDGKLSFSVGALCVTFIWVIVVALCRFVCLCVCVWVLGLQCYINF